MNPLILELLNSSSVKLNNGGSHCGGKYGGALGREELRKILKTHTVKSLKNEIKKMKTKKINISGKKKDELIEFMIENGDNFEYMEVYGKIPKYDNDDLVIEDGEEYGFSAKKEEPKKIKFKKQKNKGKKKRKVEDEEELKPKKIKLKPPKKSASKNPKEDSDYEEEEDEKDEKDEKDEEDEEKRKIKLKKDFYKKMKPKKIKLKKPKEEEEEKIYNIDDDLVIEDGEEYGFSAKKEKPKKIKLKKPKEDENNNNNNDLLKKLGAIGQLGQLGQLERLRGKNYMINIKNHKKIKK